ncbi:MAG: amino acid permease [Beijerinckiaceae bacterium]|nr:amino acid permease [Beijerinckiaceae bacterium]MCZ8300426.1 amino acid permease [Beijerinckiaceae bacterium]
MTAAEAAEKGLARSLGLTHSVLYGLGITIGAGIYVLVGLAAGRAGVHAPMAFLLAAGVMGFSAATFAELGTRIPVSASEAAYVEAAFRRQRMALAVGLLSIVTSAISAATISVGAAGYVSVFLPLPKPVLVTGIILLLGAIATRATLQAVSLAGLMTMIEVAGLAMIIGAGFLTLDLVAPILDMAPGLADATAWPGIASAALLAVFAFIGFEHLVNISEEMKDQRRTLPRALFITLGLTGLLYALVVLIAVSAVPPAELAASPAPLALVFERLTGWPLGVMSAIAVAATLNGILVNMIIIARVLYGLADRGQLPKRLAQVDQKTRAPVFATLMAVAGILGLALAVPLSGLADLASIGTLLIFVLVNLALIVIKGRETSPPPDIFDCPFWVPVAGVVTSSGMLAIDIARRIGVF